MLMTVLALLLCAGLARAQEVVRYDAKPGSKVTIAGTSTLHDWTMDGQIIGGFLEWPAAVTLDASQKELPGASDGKVNARVEASVPVRSMKSGHEGMDEVMQQAMNAKDHPKITYRMTEMKVSEPHTAGTPFQFDTKGELALNGVTNAVGMPVTIEDAGEGKLKVRGAVGLKMTDFGVKPPAPTIALGMIKTGDEVKISFTWMVVRAAKQQ